MEKDFDSKLRIESNSSNGGNIPRSKSFELGSIYGVGSYSKSKLSFIKVDMEEIMVECLMNFRGANNLIPMEIALKIAEKIRARERFAPYIVIRYG
ncbi:Phospholipase D beta 1 [Camellia lanceoleosa]|uniref:Phospholipase D beta 1 n=1 Tax=Camellia lanceoleosa TaxID=1840588 RepID=A0ACC0I1J8_9ERIC|nr:Phospholipase D beta 1 [Camellia lanceoleosa]